MTFEVINYDYEGTLKLYFSEINSIIKFWLSLFCEFNQSALKNFPVKRIEARKQKVYLSLLPLSTTSSTCVWESAANQMKWNKNERKFSLWRCSLKVCFLLALQHAFCKSSMKETFPIKKCEIHWESEKKRDVMRIRQKVWWEK